VPIREVPAVAGAGFLVVVCGEQIMAMPGLPRVPAAEEHIPLARVPARSKVVPGRRWIPHDRRQRTSIVGARLGGLRAGEPLVGSDPARRVLVLEAGGSDRSPWRSRCRPRSRSRCNAARYDWRFRTQPEPHLDGRRLHVPRGKVLGGSSSINGRWGRCARQRAGL
jgi:hypothetical protein